MRDLTTEEAGFVYGAGSSPCPPTKGSKGKKSQGKGSGGKSSGGKNKNSGSTGKNSGSYIGAGAYIG